MRLPGLSSRSKTGRLQYFGTSPGKPAPVPRQAPFAAKVGSIQQGRRILKMQPRDIRRGGNGGKVHPPCSVPAAAARIPSGVHARRAGARRAETARNAAAVLKPGSAPRARVFPQHSARRRSRPFAGSLHMAGKCGWWPARSRSGMTKLRPAVPPGGNLMMPPAPDSPWRWKRRNLFISVHGRNQDFNI